MDVESDPGGVEGNVATLVANGPVVLRGEVSIGGAPSVAQAGLCRCGHSANKPYCDGSHVAAGFEDPGAVAPGGDPIAAGGPIDVQPRPDGPNLVTGNLIVRSADGTTEWQGTKAALCRCGLSLKKPFCDGTHKSAGFTAP